jgi:hypothetical protein
MLMKCDEEIKLLEELLRKPKIDGRIIVSDGKCSKEEMFIKYIKT